MWYFAWILGLGLACSFAILNAMWLELSDEDLQKRLASPGRRSSDLPLE